MLVIGDSDCTFGLAKRIRDNMLFACPSAADNPDMRGMAHAIASAVVAELTANGVVVLTATAPPGGGPVAGTGAIT